MESIKETYTRKVNGDAYDYEAQYAEGRVVRWSARVYHNGILKGTPSGVIEDNALDGPRLRQEIVTLVECTIEQMVGINNE